MSHSTRWPKSSARHRHVFPLRLEQLEPREVPAASSTPSLDYLREVMDQYHNRFIVYEDVSSAGNHFPAFAKFPDQNAAVAVNGSWTGRPHAGATAIRNEFTDTPGANFGGLYFQNGVLPDPGPPVNPFAPGVNFGTIPNAGINLRGAVALTFWARGERGGEQIEFFMGGVGRDPTTGAAINPFPDSTPVVKQTVTLTSEWQAYRIDLGGRDLSYVLGGFGWGASDALNPGGAVFYLDDIAYELSPERQAQRLNEPRFLRSFTTLPTQPDPFDANPDDDLDFVLRNLAFTYDNAIALQAFLADGSADGLRRAMLIGDAFVYAATHDRTYTDGRLRTAYAAGDIALPPGWAPNGRAGTVPIPGFYVESQQRFFEVEQGAVDTGNNAWAMMSLLALYRRTGRAEYLHTARRIGDFIRTQQNTVGTYQGFLGGLTDPEGPSPVQRPYGSTEHNLDIYAAFTVMYQVTGEPVWLAGAGHARVFVEAMWDATRNGFLAGTTDPNTRNTNVGQFPLDVQAWSVLALPGILTLHPQVLACAETFHRLSADGLQGFDFNDDRDGVWFEGTGQMAVAYEIAGRSAAALLYRRELRRAEQTLGGNLGLPATPRDGLSTGFGFKYFRRQHIGATAWNVFAQERFNPFYGVVVSQPERLFAVGAGPGGSPSVKLYGPDGSVRYEFLAYSGAFAGGVRVAVGDLTGDGVDDLVTGAGPGGGPHVKVFDGVTKDEIASFYAYDARFAGGVYVAIGDIDGDGVADIITGAGAGGGPHVRVFSGTDFRVLWSFFAYDAGFTGGLRVAAGDIDGDGRSDLVTAAGAGGGPHVRVFSGRTGGQLNSPLGSFYAYDAGFASGVYVAAADLNGDGWADVITGPGSGGGPHTRAFSGKDGTELVGYYAYDAGFTGGVRVAARDLNGNGRAEIITGAGLGGGPHVRVFRDGGPEEWFGLFAFDPVFLGGVEVG